MDGKYEEALDKACKEEKTLTVDANVMKAICRAIEPAQDEFLLKVGNSLRVEAVDPAHAMMIKASSTGYTSDMMRVPVPMQEKMVNAIIRSKTSDLGFDLELYQADRNMIRLKWFDGEVKTSMVNPIMDIHSFLEPNIPALNLPARFECDSRSLKKWLKECEKIDSGVGLSMYNENVMISSDAEDEESFISFKLGKVEGNKGMWSSVYSLDYMLNIVTAAIRVEKEMHFRPPLVMEWNTNYPVRFSQVYNKLTVEWLLAPRIIGE